MACDGADKIRKIKAGRGVCSQHAALGVVRNAHGDLC